MLRQQKMRAQVLLLLVQVALSVYWVLEALPLNLGKSVVAVESVPQERFVSKKVRR